MTFSFIPRKSLRPRRGAGLTPLRKKLQRFKASKLLLFFRARGHYYSFAPYKLLQKGIGITCTIPCNCLLRTRIYMYILSSTRTLQWNECDHQHDVQEEDVNAHTSHGKPHGKQGFLICKTKRQIRGERRKQKLPDGASRTLDITH